ncbi:MAG TPA: toll/interleukin-1 receptor domain-containing protein [Sphingomicrobium sp.]|nr:toll/interleukin-1 receptor domain-containing protein [Sphingomicrobium sp.]
MAEQPSSEIGYFLSYSRADEKFALRLARDLRARGVAMWVDQLDIRPSEHWDRAIERAVRDCRGLVVILSPRSVASDNVADEISYAIDSGKSVLPVMIERCTLPLRLTRMQVVDATGDYDRALEQCVGELARRDGIIAAPKLEEPPRAALDANQVAAARQRLTELVGPIANRLVDKAAARADSMQDLHEMLAQHIPGAAERERFVAQGGAKPREKAPAAAAQREPAPRAEIGPAELDSISALMTRYVGPVAPVLVKRESRSSASLNDLREQLASHIPDQRDRAEFLREAEAR